VGHLRKGITMSEADLLLDSGLTGTKTVSVLDQLFPPPRAFAIRLWDGTELPVGRNPAFTLVLNRPDALRRMLTPPVELSLGEAFTYGDFDIEGDIFSAMSLREAIAARSYSFGEILALSRAVLSLPKPDATRQPSPDDARGPAGLAGAVHSRPRDRAAIQYHYDVGNDFYRLWLDRQMQYSCAYFPIGTEDLDTAQTRKLEHICRKLRLQPGERLLDIGCGWGGLAMYAARRYGVRVLGVTLSEKQAEYANYQIARAGLGDRANVKLLDYRDLTLDAFDKIVSVGMFEHVGRSRLPEYFAQAYRLLKPGGLFLNHGISHRAAVRHVANRSSASCCVRQRRANTASAWPEFFARRVLGAGSFIRQYVFPDGQLAPVSEANLVAEQAGFEVRDVENLREHYALTLRQWVQRLDARQAEAISVAGPVTYRTWRLFMAASVYGFESGNLNVNQSLLVKPNQGKTNLPLTRADLYLVEAHRAPGTPAFGCDDAHGNEAERNRKYEPVHQAG
jgi:cyclopropane-fatty-acyl-phospholipid synthase